MADKVSDLARLHEAALVRPVQPKVYCGPRWGSSWGEGGGADTCAIDKTQGDLKPEPLPLESTSAKFDGFMDHFNCYYKASVLCMQADRSQVAFFVSFPLLRLEECLWHRVYGMLNPCSCITDC